MDANLDSTNPVCAAGHEFRVLIALALAALLLFSVGIGRTGFAGKDENRYSLVAKEIVTGGDWIVMHYMGDLYPDKPPLFFWTQAISYKLFGGVSPLAARLPLILHTLLALALAWLAMRQLAGRRLATVALILLMLSFRFVWAGRWVRLDMPMCVWTYGAFWVSSRILFPKPGQAKAGAGWALAGWIFAAAAILAKGPGAVVWLGVIVTFAFASSGSRVLTKHGWWWGLPLTLGLAAAWFVPAAMRGGHEYWGAMIGTHVVERFAGEVRHGHNPFYFLYKLPSDALPMGLFLPLGLWSSWRRRRRPADRFLLCWFFFNLIFFSIPTGKRGQYILPVYPAVALMAARPLLAAMRGGLPVLNRRVKEHLWAVAVFGLVASVGFFVFAAMSPEQLKAEMPAWLAVVYGVLAAGAGAAVAFALRRGPLVRPLAVLGGAVYLGYIVVFAFHMPTMFDRITPDAIGRMIDEKASPGARVLSAGLPENYLLYGRGLPEFMRERAPKLYTQSDADREKLVAAVKNPENALMRWLHGEIPEDEIASVSVRNAMYRLSHAIKDIENAGEMFFTPERFGDITLAPERARILEAAPPGSDQRIRLDLTLLAVAMPDVFRTTRDLEEIHNFMAGPGEAWLMLPAGMAERYRFFYGEAPGRPAGAWDGGRRAGEVRLFFKPAS